ncbi:histidine kinase [Halobium salinum]|uniref:Histidine kinase n=1 Tax=Halobium salinum TaxID=1364940 RepID=A0ABD5PC37_9EURY|nr:histidine kinase [Halobium salinum]
MAVLHREKHVAGESPFETRWAWRGGAVAGFVAALVMGVAISLVQLETLRVAIAGLYGFEGSLLAGWAVHLVHGTLFGLLFAATLADPGLFRVSDWFWKTVFAGVVYGLVLAVFAAGTIMPIWLDAVGLSTQTIPNVTASLLAWHLIYGAVLGGTFYFLEGL